MYIDNKLIFIAGATGLVGSSIVRHILENCPKTRIRASFHNTNNNFVNDHRIEYICGDLRSQDYCSKAAKDCDCIIMAAANTSGSNILVNYPWEQINDNVIMNTQMLRAFSSESIKKIIYISSSTVYQSFDGSIKEYQLDLSRDPYPSYFGIGWSMRFIEKLCEFYHKRHGTDIVIARASNIYGPYAKFDPEVSNFIPAIIRKAVDKKDPFEIWGQPDVTRDVLYAEDFARAIVTIMNNEDIKFNTFNIGYGTGITVDNIVNMILKYTGHNPSIIYDKNKPTTIKSRILDCTKAKDILGWIPKYTIEEGIGNTIDWWFENKNWWKK